MPFAGKGIALGNAIFAAIQTAAIANPNNAAAIWQAIGQQIEVWLLANGTNITVTVTSVSGVQTGAGVSGPGTGTGVLT